MALSNQERQLIYSLNTKKYRQKNGQFLIEGVKLVHECILSNYQIKLIVVSGSFVEKNKEKLTKLQKNAKLKGYQFVIEKDKDFDKLSKLNTPAGVLAIVKIPNKLVLNFNENLILIIDRIMDPGNLGTIIRTADWYGLKQVLLSKECVDLYNPKVVQATMGSIFHLDIITNQDIIKNITEFKNKNYKIYSTDLNGSGEKFNNKDRVVLVLGSESHGVSKEIIKISDKLIKIKGTGQIESLNVAVSTGILLDRWFNS